MPDDTAELTGNSERIVDLPVKSSDFISLLRVIERIPAQNESWDTMKEVLELGARYGFFAVPSFILQDAPRALECNTGWSIFEFAAKQKYFPLAKLAILYFHNDSKLCHRTSEDFPPNLLADVPGNYGGALIRAMGQQPPESSREGKWERISRSFTL
jgi:hypothetical protein